MNCVYLTCCVHSDAKSINDMVDAAEEVTWEALEAGVGVDELRCVFPFYSWEGEEFNPVTGELVAELHIKDDYAVSFYESVYQGQPCFYVEHSAIEYIFVE